MLRQIAFDYTTYVCVVGGSIRPVVTATDRYQCRGGYQRRVNIILCMLLPPTCSSTSILVKFLLHIPVLTIAQHL